ncbi:hypothetical protein LSAT2_008298 [Lamellibrachia satsuma]|nr:hypothetical protein LSAT2_008298 [Lamellibrachia satsuma]
MNDSARGRGSAAGVGLDKGKNDDDSSNVAYSGLSGAFARTTATQDSLDNHLGTSKPISRIDIQDAINHNEKLCYCDPSRNSLAGDIVRRL